MVKPLIALFLLSVPSLASLAVDVFQLTSSTAFSCMYSNDYTLAVVRGFQSSGIVDPNAVNNIKNAKSGGIQDVDVYLFPCVPCANPASQAVSLVNAIKGNGYGMIWIDVQIYAWSSSQTANQNFITNMVNQLVALGQHVGIYTSSSSWQSIVGSSWAGCSNLPLWYVHYDYNPSFSDFQPFGGWTVPSMKQFIGSDAICGVEVDVDYY